jgi:HlyD family secretion protein
MNVLSHRRSGPAVAVLLSAGALWLNPWTARETVPTALAQRQPFVQTLVEAGTVSAARMMIYAAPVGAGPSKIIELTPEGTAVNPGDVLVRFDASAIELALQKEEALLRQAEAELRRTREQLRLEQLAVEADLDDARREVESKQRIADNEREGRGRLALEEARAAAADAEREQDRARTALDDVTALLGQGFATRAEVERAEQAHRRAQEALRIAALKADLLERFDRPAAVEQADAALRSAARGASTAAERASARLAQQQAGVAIAAAAVEAAIGRIAALHERAAQSVIRAAGSGIVVHRELFFGTDRRKPQVGDEVWPNQPLVALPESESLTVETRVREVDLHRVAASQRVTVSLEAYPQLRLAGEVALVGAVAQEDPSRAGTKFFPLTIRLRDGDERLRIGMTARVDVEVAAMPEAIVVPVDAVFEEDGRHYCIVLDGTRRTRRAVTIVARNHNQAAIEGLAAGTVVARGDASGGAGDAMVP